MFNEIIAYLLGITALFLCLFGAAIAIRHQKRVFDIQGAKAGLRKSFLYFILASAATGMMVYFVDKEKLVTSLCIFTGGSLFFVIFYVVRFAQLAVLEKPSFRKYRPSERTANHDDKEQEK